MVAAAFRTKTAWGLGTLFAFPIGVPLFSIFHFKRAVWPLCLGLLGVALSAGAIAVNRLAPIDLGERERMVNGERHLTLTGWDRKDYAFLKTKPDVVVLQMANPDVDDRTLEYLSGMTKLRELDLNDSQVTDAGLESLKTLSSLQSLKLKNTKITDQGFKRYLDSSDTLQKLDLRQTQVTKETAQAWKKRRSGRLLMQ